jgi:hypothetical protein
LHTPPNVSALKKPRGIRWAGRDEEDTKALVENPEGRILLKIQTRKCVSNKYDGILQWINLAPARHH